MQIKIHNYEILNFDDYSLIGSEKGISCVKSKNLRSAFHDIQAVCDKTIEIETLQTILTKNQLCEQSALAQIEAHLAIDTDLPPLYFEEVYILHGWQEFQNHITHIADQEISLPISHLPIDASSIEKIKNTKNLIILLPGSRNLTKLKTTYFAIAERLPESLIMAGHFSPTGFTVTQPYCKSLANPCLFCTLTRATHFESQTNGNCAWSAILNFCTSKNIDLPNPKPSTLQLAMIAGLITKKANGLTAHANLKFFQDNILTNTTVNLLNGLISEDSPPHWHMCDCLRAPYVKPTA